jgi:hypothetical protein
MGGHDVPSKYPAMGGTENEFVRRADVAKVIRESGLSQKELALLSGVAARTLRRIVNNGLVYSNRKGGRAPYRSPYVYFYIADRICTAVGVEVPPVVAVRARMRGEGGKWVRRLSPTQPGS